MTALPEFQKPRVQGELLKYARILRYASDWVSLPKVSDASLRRDLEKAIAYANEAVDHLTVLHRDLRDAGR